MDAGSLFVRAIECALDHGNLTSKKLKIVDLFVTRWPTAAIIFTLRSSAIDVTELEFALKLWDA